MKFKVEGDVISVHNGHNWRRLARVFKHGHRRRGGNYLDNFDKQYSQALVRQANNDDEITNLRVQDIRNEQATTNS